jgi:integrase
VAMIGNGAPMPVISAVLGHASTDTTQAYYLNSQELHQTGEKLQVA